MSIKNAWLFPPLVLALHWWTGWTAYVVVFNLGLSFLLYKYCYSVLALNIIDKPTRDSIVLSQVGANTNSLTYILGGLVYYCLISTYLAAQELLLTLGYTTLVFLAGNHMILSVLKLKLPKIDVQERKQLFIPEDEE